MNVGGPEGFGSGVFEMDSAGLRTWAKRAIFGACIIVPAAALLWYFVFSARTTPNQQPDPPVRVVTVVMRPVTVTENQIGTVVSVATVQVTSLVSGQLLSADFKEGDLVKADQPIFHVDPKPYAAALEQAQAALARDSATLKSAEKDKERYIRLAARKAVSEQQRDTAVATADADAATVQADKAALDMAELNLGYTVIRSPVDGKTGPVLVQPGNLVQANNASAPLVVITQLQPIKISFFAPQSELPKLQDRLRQSKLVATIVMHDAAGGRIVAPIDFIGNQVNAQTGTIELRATFPNRDSRLVPGQLVDVTYAVADIPNALVVPRDAVYLGPDQRYVYVVDGQNKAQLRNVAILFDDGKDDAIDGPVRDGDHVIIEGQIRVTPGATVDVLTGPPQASEGSDAVVGTP